MRTSQTRRPVRVVVALLCVVGVLSALPGGASALDVPTELAVGSTPVTDGVTVVWSGSANWDNDSIYAMRLDDRQVVPVAVDATVVEHITRTWPDVSGNFVVWIEDPYCCPGSAVELRGKNLVSGEEFIIATGFGYDWRARISGTTVVWMTDYAITMRDIASMAAPATLVQLTPTQFDDTRIEYMAFDGTYVVWEEASYDSMGVNQTWRLRAFKIGASAPIEIAHGVSPQGGIGGIGGFDVAGDIVAYTSIINYSDSAVIAVNLATGEQTVVDHGTLTALPTTDGRYIFWSTFPPDDTGGYRLDLRGYDLLTDSTFTVIFDVGLNTDARVEGGVLVWQRGVNERTVHVAAVSDVLPSSRQADPGKSGPNWLSFPETAHYLGYDFKTFWERNGGLSVFGYPLTEAFSEHGIATQFTERQRFELHPEHAGTPYEVELGRLGADDARARGLYGSEAAFAPLATADPGCAMFVETGHTACGAFLAYWQTHGLNIGDDGNAYRESLALFGYPLSEPYSDPDTGLTIQYFERAVFEYHPENAGTPYAVLLRRLGAEQLAARGW